MNSYKLKFKNNANIKQITKVVRILKTTKKLLREIKEDLDKQRDIPCL